MKRIFYIVVFCLGCLAFVYSDNYVIINQVMYDSPLNEKVTVRPYSHGEFLELYNAGNSAVSLGGWKLIGSGSTEKVTLPSTLSIPAGGYLLIAYRYTNAPEFQLSDLFTLPTYSSDYSIYYQDKVVLSNSGESIVLKNASDVTVDSLYYHGTSNKSNPNRLHAENADSIAGSECVSLHRTAVEFDELGCAIYNDSSWVTGLVTFATHQLPKSSYEEDYLTNEQPLPDAENYIVSITPLDPTNRINCTDGQLSVDGNIRTNAIVTYYDGLGRPYETVALKHSPSRNDLVSMTSYSGLNRATHQWLPISEEANGQPLSTESFISKAGTFYNDNRPYQETLYEASALNRVVGTVRPGNEYATHPSTQSYEINTANDAVRIFSVVHNELSNGRVENQLQCTNSSYDAYTLYKSTVSDEDGKSITTFTDKLGRVILERQSNNDTYYVYDLKGQLCYVLPPLAANQISTGIYNDSVDILKQFAYIYRYDERGNQIYKRLPGCEPTLMVYDVTNTLVMSQTGNQRERGTYWTVYKYDELRRLIYTAEVDTKSNDHAALMDSFSQWYVVEQFSTGSLDHPMANTGYSRGYYHVQPTKLLTVNYYDNYDFLNFVSDDDRTHMAFNAFDANSEYGNATGLLTGTRTYTLDGSGDYSETVYYYDYLGREIQRRSTNHMGGYDILSTKYDFANAIIDTWSSQSTKNDSIITEHYHYTYDHIGRPLTTTYTFNDEIPIVLQSYNYDELGRVHSRHIHGGVDSVAFSYDICSQITQIKSSNYEQKYYYNQTCPIGNGTVTPAYNGNISATTWTCDNQVNGYMYYYDNMNRLTSTYSILNNEWGDYYYSENFTYDAHGNITNLYRWDDYDVIDNLYMTYNGNQLMQIEDTWETYNYEGKEYHDNNSSTEDDFAYDANGNMIYDKDRGIAAINYNLLNLPDEIRFTNGNLIIHRYDATGNRLETRYLTPKIPTTVPLGNVLPSLILPGSFHITRDVFHNNIVYNVDTNDVYGIKFVHNTEGYIRYNNMNEHYHFYYIKDHLGNVRETYKIPNAGTKECVQRMQYYPSGLPWEYVYNSSAQPYKYNSKEFVEMHGLDEYDSKARWYYPAICRTTTMDPLAEKYYSISPYAWCGNNPVRFVDPDGMDWYQDDSTGMYVWFDEDPDSEQYTYIGGRGSLLGESESLVSNILHDLYGTDSLYTNGKTLGIVSPDKGGVFGEKGLSDGILAEFVLNNGPEISILYENHPYTQRMMLDDRVVESQQNILNGETSVSGQITNVGRNWYLWDVILPKNWHAAPQFIGSYSFDAYTSSNGELLNIISDSKSRRSLLLHIPKKNKSRKESKYMGNTYQFYIWKSKK